MRVPERIRLIVYTDGTSRGGAEVVLRTLVAGLPDRFAVTVLGTDDEVVRWVAGGRPAAEVAVVPAVRNKGDVVRFARLRRAIAGHRPDLFQANLTSLPSCQYALLAASTVADLPTIAVEHAPLASPSPLSRQLKRWTSRRLAAHVAVGSSVAREIESLIGLRAGSLRVIHNGVPAPARARATGLPGPVISAVGRLDHLKGFDVLIEAVAGLEQGSLLIVGEGPDRSRLEALAETLGIGDRVHLPGWADDAPALVGASDVFVLPSHLESLPLSVLEAMHAGVPVIATPVGSVPDVVRHGRTGLLVDVGDAEALQQAIRQLTQDPARRRELGARGQEVARREFSADRMLEGYVSLYEHLLAGRG